MKNGYEAKFSGKPMSLEDLLKFFNKSNPDLFDKAINGFVIYSNCCYDLDESGGEEIYSFLTNFFQKSPNESAQSFFGLNLLILCFRPRASSKKTFDLIREALTYFDYNTPIYLGYAINEGDGKISYHNFP